MKLTKKSQTQKFTNSATCYGFEYGLEDKDINLARVIVHGRYPEEGSAVNEVCKEIGYVIGGSGSLFVEGKQYKLETGDVVLINPGERFYWQGEKLEMLMPCTPAFYPEQHKIELSA